MKIKNSSMNATEKIVAVLECVADGNNSLRIKEISELLEMDRGTVYRLVSQLAEQNMLKVNADTKKISVGVRAFHIGVSFLNNGIVGEQIKYLLAKTAEKYPMAVGCAAADDSMVRKGQVYGLYEISTLTNIGFHYEEGRCYAINAGVYGRVIMANHEPISEIEEIVRSIPLEKRTFDDMEDTKELLAEYEKIRTQGYAYNLGNPGDVVKGIGVPVRNGVNRVIGCIGAAIYPRSDDEKTREEVLAALTDCAGNVGILFPGESTII